MYHMWRSSGITWPSGFAACHFFGDAKGCFNKTLSACTLPAQNSENCKCTGVSGNMPAVCWGLGKRLDAPVPHVATWKVFALRIPKHSADELASLDCFWFYERTMVADMWFPVISNKCKLLQTNIILWLGASWCIMGWENGQHASALKIQSTLVQCRVCGSWDATKCLLSSPFLRVQIPRLLWLTTFAFCDFDWTIVSFINSHQLSQYWPKRLGEFLRLQLRVTYIDLEMAPKKGTKRAAEAWRNWKVQEVSNRSKRRISRQLLKNCMTHTLHTHV